MSILDFQKRDEVIMINEDGNKGSFEFRPLEPGYGLTVGNALESSFVIIRRLCNSFN